MTTTQTKPKYIIAPHTFYDADKQLYYTDIFLNLGIKPHIFTCYGVSQDNSRESAANLIMMFDTVNSFAK